MIDIIDNALPEPIFKKLYNQVIDSDFPWYLSNDINKSRLEGSEEENPGLCEDNYSISSYQFVHILYDLNSDIKIRSSYFNLFNKVIFNFLENKNMTGHLYRSKLNLLTNLHKIKDNSLYNIPHVDIDIPHFSVLLYLNDSDGDTVIYENKFKGYDKVPHFDDLVEKKRVTPKAGRVVIFNGKHWHTSNQPEHNVRCIINYNLV